MRTRSRVKKRWWKVTGFGYVGKFWARWPAGAVTRFGKVFGQKLGQRRMAIRTDVETGGWNLSVSLIGD